MTNVFINLSTPWNSNITKRNQTLSVEICVLWHHDLQKREKSASLIVCRWGGIGIRAYQNSVFFLFSVAVKGLPFDCIGQVLNFKIVYFIRITYNRFLIIQFIKCLVCKSCICLIAHMFIINVNHSIKILIKFM